jgi:hypothetical protein
VATPGLGGGQIAVLHSYAAVSWLRNDCTILAELSERITQLQYLLQLSLRTSENSVKGKFAERGQCEVLRSSLLGASVNKAGRKGHSPVGLDPSHSSRPCRRVFSYLGRNWKN